MKMDIDNLNEVIISRSEYEQFRRALSFCRFVSSLNTPLGARARQKITLTKLIDNANTVLDMKDD